MTVEQLDKISAQRLEDVDIDTLVEVNSIKYADGMPVEKKVAGMIAKTGNPYFRRSGKCLVKIASNFSFGQPFTAKIIPFVCITSCTCGYTR